MKVALAHDWLTGMRGGEKVLERIAHRYPDAPIYTLLHIPGTTSAAIESHPIRTSFVQRIPVPTSYRWFLPLFPLAVRGLDVTSYDLIISTSHCAIKALRRGSDAVHICYCHTPMRYAWDQFDAYFGRQRIGVVRSALARPILAWLRHWDRATQGRVDHYIANSNYVAGRIRQYYDRDAIVVPPPVDTERFVPTGAPPDDFYLVVSALSPYKQIEVAIDAFRGRRERLIVVGWGPEEARLRANAPANVELAGKVDDDTLLDLYQRCRGFILPAVEDAGIAPIEAMACGRPAIVLGRGGAPEAVLDGRTGLHVAEANAAAFSAAVDRAEVLSFNTEEIRRHAESYDTRRFDQRMGEIIDRLGRADRRSAGRRAGNGGGNV